jgi:hypothetical protein
MNSQLSAGLPDFSWYKIPKQREIYQVAIFCRQYLPDSDIPLRTGNTGRCGFLFYARSRTVIPNGHKTFPMEV